MLSKLIAYFTALVCLSGTAQSFLLNHALRMPKGCRYGNRLPTFMSADGAQREDLRNVAIIAHVDHGDLLSLNYHNSTLHVAIT